MEPIYFHCFAPWMMNTMSYLYRSDQMMPSIKTSKSEAPKQGRVTGAEVGPVAGCLFVAITGRVAVPLTGMLVGTVAGAGLEAGAGALLFISKR